MKEPIERTLKGAKLIDGKTAMITGAASGIGRACARLFSNQGGRLVLVDLNFEDLQQLCEEINGQGGEAIALKGDVTQEADLDRIFQSIRDAYGSLDILVNNAGGGLSTDFLEITSEEWNSIINLNLTSVFSISQRAVSLLKDSGCGSIVNISSVAGRSMSLTAGCHYTSAKAGLLGLSRHMAGTLAPYGIRVNVVCPGVTNSERIVGRLETKGTMQQVTKAIPLGRIGDTFEIASCCLFLASDLAGYVTGATLDANGGILMV